MHFIKEANYIKDYLLLATFEDGTKKIFDMSPYLENNSLIFRPLKQKDIFKMYKIEGNTITWITGADVSPDFVYENGVSVKS